MMLDVLGATDQMAAGEDEERRRDQTKETTEKQNRFFPPLSALGFCKRGSRGVKNASFFTTI